MLRINISATCCYALLLPQDVAAAAFRFDFILFFPSLILAVVVIIAIVDAVLGGALQKVVLLLCRFQSKMYIICMSSFKL